MKHAILIAVLIMFCFVVVFITKKMSEDGGSIFSLLGAKAHCGAHCLVR
jgi:hypothetical protein